MPLATFKFRRGTEAQWTMINPILGAGEPGFETDTNRLKLGNGASHWADLEYFYSSSAILDFLASSDRLSDVALDAKYAAKSIEDIINTGRLSATSLTDLFADKGVEETIATGRLSDDALATFVRDLIVFGTIAGTSVQGNDARLSSATKNANIIIETSTGVWTDDATARTGGAQKILFIGVSDPADATNGIDTPGNINSTDTWLRRV